MAAEAEERDDGDDFVDDEEPLANAHDASQGGNASNLAVEQARARVRNHIATSSASSAVMYASGGIDTSVAQLSCIFTTILLLLDAMCMLHDFAARSSSGMPFRHVSTNAPTPPSPSTNLLTLCFL